MAPRLPRIDLPAPDVALPVRGGPYERPSAELLSKLGGLGSASTAGMLAGLGIRRSHILGPVARIPGQRVVGHALTLQFMPRREDLETGSQEEFERSTALWAVLDAASANDILVVQAHGDMSTGCLGEMLSRYFQARGGIGLVVDGCVRDWPRIERLGLPVWARGTTPHFATQTNLVPWGYDVPVACGGILVMPGDVVIADDDGAVAIPARVAPLLAEYAAEMNEKEAFSRERLDAGGELQRYYPLDADALREFERWQAGAVSEPDDGASGDGALEAMPDE